MKELRVLALSSSGLPITALIVSESNEYARSGIIGVGLLAQRWF